MHILHPVPAVIVNALLQSQKTGLYSRKTQGSYSVLHELRTQIMPERNLPLNLATLQRLVWRRRCELHALETPPIVAICACACFDIENLKISG